MFILSASGDVNSSGGLGLSPMFILSASGDVNSSGGLGLSPIEKLLNLFLKVSSISAESNTSFMFIPSAFRIISPRFKFSSNWKLIAFRSSFSFKNFSIAFRSASLILTFTSFIFLFIVSDKDLIL